jgi:N-glycosylase/DNA lyase
MHKPKRKRLVQAILDRPPEHDIEIKKLRKNSRQISKRPDWLWHLLLSSMSTMGISRGYKGLIENPQNYNLVSYTTLIKLAPKERIVNIRQALQNGSVLRYKPKTRWLANNISFILDCGGIESLQHFILKAKGKDSKIRLIKLFEGIGDKYARNIFMDIHHEDFIDSITIDERITKILDALMVEHSLSYLEKEQFLIELAKDCGISPWHLDRLLYLFVGHYISKIE